MEGYSKKLKEDSSDRIRSILPPVTILNLTGKIASLVCRTVIELILQDLTHCIRIKNV